jgi:hypothetical protein
MKHHNPEAPGILYVSRAATAQCVFSPTLHSICLVVMRLALLAVFNTVSHHNWRLHLHDSATLYGTASQLNTRRSCCCHCTGSALGAV